MTTNQVATNNMGQVRCRTCSTESPEGTRVCPSCGEDDLATMCGSCGFENLARSRFCGHCAAPLRRADEPAPAQRPLLLDERRQLTVLFCDLVDASALSEKLDPEDMRALLREYHTVCTDIVRRCEGYVAQYMGDGLLVYFGFPLAHDDVPCQAVRAGLALVEAVREIHPQLTVEMPIHLQVRVGIHTGDVVLGEMGDHLRPQSLAVGETVNLAERVQRSATPDSVAVSEVTERLTRGYFAFQALASRQLKGFARPVELFQVIEETGAQNRLEAAATLGLTPFIGREKELATLEDAWRRALAGQAPVLLLSGEPGIGKSRHVRMLKERIAPEPYRSIESFCSPYFQGTALHPIIDMLERGLGLSRNVSVEEKLSRVEAEMARVNFPLDTAVPLLASLLSLPTAGRYPLREASSPQRQRQATFELLVDWLAEGTKAQPVLFVVEDLHWADPSTLELIGLLLQRTPPGPLLIILVHRPEFTPPWEHERLVRLHLERVSPTNGNQMVEALTRHRPLPPDVARQVLARADGIPLFIEEITKSVLESAGLRETDRQPSEGNPRSAHLDIPPTVRDSLAARIDRLGFAKPVAQLAATMGRTFTRELLEAVSDITGGQLDAALARLIQAGLIFSRGHAHAPTYVFKHAMLQDAAYESLLRSSRQRYHERIARALTERLPEVAATQPELLARHYAGAGLVPEAISQWALAGQRAMGRSAFGEAIANLERALEQLASLPASEANDRQEIELRAGLGLALISTRGFSSAEVEATYGRARELCEKFGDVPMRILFGVWAVQIVRADGPGTERLAILFQRLAESSADESERLIAHACLVTRAFYLAEYDIVRADGKRGKALCHVAEPGPQNQRLMSEYGYEGLLYSHLFLAWADATQGRLAECEHGLEEARGIAERAGHPYLKAMVFSFGAVVWRDLGRDALAADWAARSIALSQENGFVFWLAGSLFISGWVAAKNFPGPADEPGTGPAAAALMEQGVSIYRQMGARINFPYYLACLAESRLRQRRIEDGLAAVQEALEILGESPWQRDLPELLRLRGELRSQGRQTAAVDEEAERDLRRSLELARQQGAQLFQLHSGRALGQFLMARGRIAEAREMMTTVLDATTPPLQALPAGEVLRALLTSLEG